VKPLRLFLADDHTLVRAGIRGLVSAIPGVEVVGEAGEGREALEAILRLRPDVALLDISMPGLNGLDLTARLARAAPEIRVLILSMHTSEEYVLQALRAGAAGYLLKGSEVSELPLAVQAVARGDRYLSPAVSRQVIDEYLRHAEAEPDPIDALTPRQREILQLVAEGHTSKEVAQKLQLSSRTVEEHRRLIMERLGVHDVTGLVRVAIRMGLVAAEP
jgi:DNA-binding NarL/FixJ family response regulator